MTQKEELRLPIEKVQSKQQEVEAAPGSPRSPVAFSEDEHLRRVFGDVGVPPAPHPKFVQYLHGWNTYVMDTQSASQSQSV
mmetsp:Transcript_44542/g.70851  ORF Transcript_44542/g.70851 Transcript_44542/m.70851 type:complete len:81 (+) Transcript_44542:67-309(+)